MIDFENHEGKTKWQDNQAGGGPDWKPSMNGRKWPLGSHTQYKHTNQPKFLVFLAYNGALYAPKSLIVGLLVVGSLTTHSAVNSV